MSSARQDSETARAGLLDTVKANKQENKEAELSLDGPKAHHRQTVVNPLGPSIRDCM